MVEQMLYLGGDRMATVPPLRINFSATRTPDFASIAGVGRYPLLVHLGRAAVAYHFALPFCFTLAETAGCSRELVDKNPYF